MPVDRAVTDEELLQVHSAEYLAQIKRSGVLAAALEIPLVKHVPASLLHWRVVRPMRWAVRGSVWPPRPRSRRVGR